MTPEHHTLELADDVSEAIETRIEPGESVESFVNGLLRKQLGLPLPSDQSTET